MESLDSGVVSSFGLLLDDISVVLVVDCSIVVVVLITGSSNSGTFVDVDIFDDSRVVVVEVTRLLDDVVEVLVVAVTGGMVVAVVVS